MQKDTNQNLSSYCDYNESFTVYDQVRQPYGLEDLIQIFKETKTPLKDQKILEGGFGTGAYINHFTDLVSEIYGVEGSKQGLEQALRKMGDKDNVNLQFGNILKLSFPENNFDAYMVNQVLHHLDTEPNFPNLTTFLEEGKRVLKPGGVLTINTSTQKQLHPDTGVYWNYKYIPEAASELRSRYMPIDELCARLKQLQFVNIKLTIPSGKIFNERYYNDPAIALEPVFQNGDSVYSFLTTEEYENGNARIKASIEDGIVLEEMKRAAKCIADIGESVIVSARKPIIEEQ